MKNFSIIVAFDEHRGIGKGGVMPWHLPADLKHFRDITSPAASGEQNAVIMGRKTWESIPGQFRPLPGRVNAVITRQPGYALPEGVLRASSLTEALESLGGPRRSDIGKIFVIGGAQVFAEAIVHPACQSLYLTHISGSFDCDVFFPDIPAYFIGKHFLFHCVQELLPDKL
jgi:dihydrofolate reductase